MATAVGAANSTSSSYGSGKPKGFQDLTGTDFIKVMIAQLQQQDPMNPSNSDQMLTQLSQIRSLESSEQLNTTLSGMGLQQSIASGAGMIGKTVTGIGGDGKPLTGKVTSVKVEDKKVYLELDSGNRLALYAVTNVSPETVATATSGSART